MIAGLGSSQQCCLWALVLTTLSAPAIASSEKDIQNFSSLEAETWQIGRQKNGSLRGSMIDAAQDMPSCKDPPFWTAHPGKNCFPGHGAAKVAMIQTAFEDCREGYASAGDCQAMCQVSRGCEAVVYFYKKCCLRKDVVLNDCADEAPEAYTTYTKGDWTWCEGCMYEASPNEKASQFILEHPIWLGMDAAVSLLALTSGCDLVYSALVEPITTHAPHAAQWYCINLGIDATPVASSSQFDKSKVSCGQPQQKYGGLWLRTLPKPEDYIFLNDKARTDLGDALSTQMGLCYTNYAHSIADHQWVSFFQGMAADRQRQFWVSLVSNALVLAVVLLPEVSISASLLLKAFGTCGLPCTRALTFVRKALQDPEKLKKNLQNLVAKGVERAAKATSKAESEVGFTTDAGNVFLQHVLGNIDAITVTKPLMTNLQLYLLKEQYTTVLGSGSNCTLDGTKAVFNTYVTQMTLVKNSKYKEYQEGPPAYTSWGQGSGMCKSDSATGWTFYDFGFESWCTPWKEKPTPVLAEYLDIAKSVAVRSLTLCHTYSCLY